MEKITYLFGAGASCEVLPINNEIPARIELAIEKMKILFNSSIPSPNMTDTDLFQHLLNDLFWLAEEAKKHASVDTLAKKLFLRHEDVQLKRLKLALSVFFIIEQHCLPGKRYDAFFATLLSGSITGIPNIKILTWNYDFQFELAYAGFTDETISANQTLLNVITKQNSYERGIEDKFSIFKINGDCSLQLKNSPSDEFHWSLKSNNLSGGNIKEIVRLWDEAVTGNTKYISNLSFAWEGKSPGSKAITFFEETKKALKNTTILVVIGYSFPYFNRETDRELMKAMGSVSKIYFQAPNAKDIIERFEAVQSYRIPSKIPIYNTDQFFIPNEF